MLDDAYAQSKEWAARFGKPVRFRRDGFCVFASAVLQSAQGTTHAIGTVTHRMARCGRGAKSVPMRATLVTRWTKVTCLRCVMNLLLDANRAGELRGVVTP